MSKKRFKHRIKAKALLIDRSGLIKVDTPEGTKRMTMEEYTEYLKELV